ncbi:conserved protein of unknown function [Candidatus Hydrogenisulfobacillus filiaventi]|uniref:Uncharacterized protein n=1 Tax=Candidatus Hydrogenisulfobacillus filiaventi TaxID=2707344 RepID=A0A6F8ZK74_9FIRM|nr:conserved protein of unknown function [Candidatus Hydrogenisulfobacillus filiaventi]
MGIAGWILGLAAIAAGIWLWRYPSRYGRGFVQAISLIVILGGVYIIWAADLLARRPVLHHPLF